MAIRGIGGARWKALFAETPGVAEAVGGPSQPASSTVSAGDDWRHWAACRGQDPELFFPVGIGLEALTQTQQAQAVCRRCPVQSECYDYAWRNGILDGVWGGCGEEERRARKRREQRQRQRDAA